MSTPASNIGLTLGMLSVEEIKAREVALDHAVKTSLHDVDARATVSRAEAFLAFLTGKPTS